MKKNTFEIVIGVMVIAISFYFAFFIYEINSKNKTKKYYTLYAIFDNVEGVNAYSKIKIGGLEVGEVASVMINDNYRIELKLKINNNLKIPIDSTMKISTSGIIGSKFLKLEIGGEDETFKDGDYFEFTQSTMELEEMITKFMLNRVSNEKKNDKSDKKE